MSGRQKETYGLPDRWLDYVPLGVEIQGQRIRACKVPLSETFLSKRHAPLDLWFTPLNVIALVPNLGCVIDVTATDKYYNPKEFTTHGIQHHKIFCVGKKLPKPNVVKRFFCAVDMFLNNPEMNDKVLLVHCTHGLNRTGYLSTRYMVERLGIPPAVAIAAFEAARGHRIEREYYTEDVLTRRQIVDLTEEQESFNIADGHRRGQQGSGQSMKQFHSTTQSRFANNSHYQASKNVRFNPYSSDANHYKTKDRDFSGNLHKNDRGAPHAQRGSHSSVRNTKRNSKAAKVKTIAPSRSPTEPDEEPRPGTSK